ncbi:unnamed protein product [Orchesella dallaii]|uniref:Gustatory receptor n=1 Tax=Orchesella dallaii TaxID=48710 RepID=A0ABP1QGM4_9HEXA
MHPEKKIELIMLHPEFPTTFRKQGDSYFQTFFNFMFYLLFVPFKVVVDGESGDFILKFNLLQKVLCATIHLAAIGLGAFYIVVYAQNMSSTKDVPSLFLNAGSLASYMSIIIAIKTVWFNQPAILGMLQETRVAFSTEKKRMLLKASLLSLILWMFSVHTGMGLFSAFGSEAVSPAVLMSIRKVVEICEQFVGSTGTGSWPWSPKIKFIIKILLIEANNFYNIPRIIIMVSALTFLGMGKEFESLVQDESCLKRVIRKYDSLREAVGKTNGVVGGIMLAQYITVLSFLASSPCLMSDRSTQSIWVLVEKFYITFTYSLYGVFLVVACDMPKRVRLTWKYWMINKRLCEELTSDEHQLMTSFTLDVESESLGLSCSFFTLTYSFIGSMIGLVATYGILIYQMQK